MEESRTHEASLQQSGNAFIREFVVKFLVKLPPIQDLHGDGLRFIAMPSFGTSEYALAVSLRSKASGAAGTLVVLDKTNDVPRYSHRRFSMPTATYRALVADIDRLTDSWPGDADDCWDGSPVAFERVRGTRVTSGLGNCSPHYGQLKLRVLNVVRRSAPGPDLPTENDWHRFEPER
ncbi:MAG: hypothetical protein PGN09_04200 [Sphingomonas fennica]